MGRGKCGRGGAECGMKAASSPRSALPVGAREKKDVTTGSRGVAKGGLELEMGVGRVGMRVR